MGEVSALLVQLETPQGKLVDVGFIYNADEKNWFEFSELYWNLPYRPVLGQTFEEHGRSWRPSAHVALPIWFSHLLPEGRLREAVASAAATNKAREFNLLARIGIDDLPGALRVGPADELHNIKRPPELTAAEHGENENPLLKFSLAGAQLKFSIFKGAKGLTVPVKGQAGQGAFKAGWHAHMLNQPGAFLISDPEHTVAERHRAYLIDEANFSSMNKYSFTREELDLVRGQTRMGAVAKLLPNASTASKVTGPKAAQPRYSVTGPTDRFLDVLTWPWRFPGTTIRGLLHDFDPKGAVT